jgi:hypothetical protein
MPTSNKPYNLPLEENELIQWRKIAQEQGLDLTQFIRQAVRKEVKALGYTPSTYEYRSGQRNQNK